MDPSCRRCECRAQRTQHVTPREEEWEVVCRTDCACPHQEQSMSVSVLFSLFALASHRATTPLPPKVPTWTRGTSASRRSLANSLVDRTLLAKGVASNASSGLVDLHWTDVLLAALHSRPVSRLTGPEQCASTPRTREHSSIFFISTHHRFLHPQTECGARPSLCHHNFESADGQGRVVPWRGSQGVW